MKKQTLYIIIFAFLIIGAVIFFTRRKELIGGEPAAPPPPVKSGPTQGGETQTVNVDDPQTEAAIQSRLKVIANNAGKREQALQQIDAQSTLLKGLRSPTGIKTILIPQQVNSLTELEIFPTDLPQGAAQNSTFSAVEAAEDLESLHKKIGLDAAKSQWFGLADFSGNSNFSLYSPLTEQLVLSGQFGSSGSADKNKSEQWGYWSEDVKTFAANAGKVQKELTKVMREQAITDLIGVGWKIQGYNA